MPIGEGMLRLKVQSDKEFYTFCYSIGEMPFKEICKASTRFLSCEVAGKCFTGTVIGLYTVSGGESDVVMEVMKFSSR